MTEFTDIPITPAARRALEEAGITTVEALAARSREEIAGVRGVGPAALAVIERELAARGLAFGTPVAEEEVAEPAPEPVPEPAPARSGDAPAAAPPDGTPLPQPPLSGLSTVAATGPGYNPFAIIALILLLALPPAAIVVGHIALGQLRRTPQKGHDIALVATILGYLFTVFLFLVILSWLLAVAFAIAIGVGAGGLGPGTPFPADPTLFEGCWRGF